MESTATSKQVAQDMDRVDQQITKSTRSMGLFAQAFRGAFVGAIAGMTFATIIGGITGIANATFDAAKAAVQAAAEYQVTRNAFVVFSGSVSMAREELRQIAEVARRTPGLRLEDAEQGAKNLRALGFQAQLTLDLVEGISKQKILSGADEGAVNRVIVNLTQLASGSPRASQDIREMIQSIRTLRPEIIETFGSIERFRQEILRDPEGALGKFAKGLKDTQVPAAGLTDATYKLLDAWMVAGRQFGEPILDPLTDSVKMLTDALYANENTWRSWGQGVADAIRGVNIIASEQSAGGGPSMLLGAYGSQINQAGWRATLGLYTLGLSEAYYSSQRIGEAERLKQEQARLAREIEGEPALRRQLGVQYGPVSESMIGERNVERQRQERKAQADADIARRLDLESLKRNKEEVLAVTRDRYRIEEAMLASHLRFTSVQELNYLRSVGSTKIRAIQDELTVTKNFYDKSLALTEKGTNEERNLLAERSVAISKLNAELRIQEFENARAIAEQEHRIREERRRAEIEFKQLQIKDAQERLDNQMFYIEREIQMNETGYDKLVDATRQSFEQIQTITRQAYDLQLQDASLTAEQRINIEKERDLELQAQANRQAQQMQQIRDRMWEQTIRNIQRQGQTAQNLLGGRGQINQAAFDLFSPEFLTSGRAGQAIESVFGGYVGASRQFQSDAAKAQSMFGAKQISQAEFQAAIDLANRSLATLRQMQGQIPGIQFEILGLIEDVQAGRGDYTIFDTIAEKTLEASRILERSKLESQLNTITAELEAMTSAGIVSGGEITAKRGEKTLIEQQLQAFDLTAAKAKLTAETIKNLRQEIDALTKGDPVANAAIQYQNYQAALVDQRNALVEARAQELRLSDQNLLNLEREIAFTKELTAVKEEEFQAVLRIDAARLRIDQQLIYSQNRADAAVLEFLANQKGITEIISDTKINILTTAYSGLEAVADRLTRKFGAFRDVIKDLISNLLKLAFNKLFGQFFAPGGSGGGFGIGGFGGGGGGGFGGLGGINLGGLGSYTTPPFNPGAGILGGGAIGGGFGGDLASVGDYGAGIMSGNLTLLGQGVSTGSSAGAGIAQAGLGGAVAGMLPFLGLGLGSQLGAPSVGAQILGGAGGALLGGMGMAAILGTTTGVFAAGGSLAFLTPLLTNPFTAIIGGILLAGAFFLGRNAQRRKDERTRNAAMISALEALDKLIEGVRNDTMDGAMALEQAAQIREQYMQQMGQLKDKKTRNIALKDVSRLDAKISEIKTATTDQVARRERLELMVPTFAWGGSMGYQQGAGHGMSDSLTNYFPAYGGVARTSPTEYVLDADTTGSIGRANLDLMRATKGASYNQMRRQTVTPRMQAGGVPGSPGFYGTMVQASSQPMALEVSLNVGLSAESFANVISATLKNHDGSKQQLDAIVTALKNQGSNELIRYLVDELEKF